MAQGKAEGLAQGKAEGIKQTNRDNARKMKLKGIPLDIIADVTGISIDEIQQL